MKTTEFQKEIARKAIKKKKVILELDCRMGKSHISIIASRAFSSVVVVCPPKLFLNWKKEINLVYKDNKTKPTILKSTQKQDFKNYKPHLIIVDEAHKFNKYKTSRELFNLIKKAEYRFFLTATSLINRHIDYYWMLKLCEVHNMNYRDFAIKFNSAKIGHRNFLILGEPSNKRKLLHLRQKASIIRRRELKLNKFDIYFDNPINLDVSFENYSILQKLIAVKKSNDSKIKKEIKKLYLKHNKIIYFYFHNIILKSYCKGKNFINGSVSMTDRQARINKFIQKEKGYLFVNYLSGGEGLNIPADAVCFIEQTWSKALDYQAYMRAYGFKRDNPLHIYYLKYDNEKKMIVNNLKTKQHKNFIIEH